MRIEITRPEFMANLDLYRKLPSVMLALDIPSDHLENIYFLISSAHGRKKNVIFAPDFIYYGESDVFVVSIKESDLLKITEVFSRHAGLIDSVLLTLGGLAKMFKHLANSIKKDLKEVQATMTDDHDAFMKENRERTIGYLLWKKTHEAGRSRFEEDEQTP